jgi:hypothetical protein
MVTAIPGVAAAATLADPRTAAAPPSAHEVLTVASKRGCRVRTGVDTATAHRGELAAGTVVVATREAHRAGATARRRLLVPVEGYVSQKCLASTEDNAPPLDRVAGDFDVYGVSDVHVDDDRNMRALERACAALEGAGAGRKTALILAGDVSHDLAVLRRCLALVKRTFDEIFFVPGNHELWVATDGDSLAKLELVLATCAAAGVRTAPAVLGDAVVVVPLLSWYAFRCRR